MGYFNTYIIGTLWGLSERKYINNRKKDHIQEEISNFGTFFPFPLETDSIASSFNLKKLKKHMESSYYIVEADNAVNLSSNLVMENGVKTSRLKLQQVWNQAGSNLFHHIVPNSELDCREIRGRNKSWLWSSDTRLWKDGGSRRRGHRRTKLNGFLEQAESNNKKKYPSIQETDRNDLTWKWVYIIYESPFLLFLVKQQKQTNAESV